MYDLGDIVEMKSRMLAKQIVGKSFAWALISKSVRIAGILS